MGQDFAGHVDMRPGSDPPPRPLPHRPGEPVQRPADRRQLGSPAGHQLPLRHVVLGGAGAAGRDLAGPVGRVAPLVHGGRDLRRPLGVQLEDLVGDPCDPPLPQPSRRTRIPLDAVAELEGPAGGRHPPCHGRRMQVFSPQRRVGRLPPTPPVEHLDHVRDQHVIMRAGVPRTRGRVPGVGVDQPAGGRRNRCTTAPPADRSPIEIGQRRIPFGVHDRMHVLRPADHPQFGDRLVRRDDQLHARPACRNEPFTIDVPGAARPEDRLIRHRVHRPGQAQSSAGTAPHQRCLPPGRVVGERLAGVIIAPFEDRRPVVSHRLLPHHPHPRHDTHLLSGHWTVPPPQPDG
jgi:hypothetical protein